MITWWGNTYEVSTIGYFTELDFPSFSSARTPVLGELRRASLFARAKHKKSKVHVLRLVVSTGVEEASNPNVKLLQSHTDTFGVAGNLLCMNSFQA
jgi:hypothetical protein